MDKERSHIELPLCGTPYRMTLGKWNSWKHLSLNLKLIHLGSSFTDFVLSLRTVALYKRYIIITIIITIIIIIIIII